MLLDLLRNTIPASRDSIAGRYEARMHHVAAPNIHFLGQGSDFASMAQPHYWRGATDGFAFLIVRMVPQGRCLEI